MIRISRLSLALVLALGLPVAQADDLLDIYREARAADPTLAGAEASKLATDEGVVQARAQLLPQLGARLDYTHSRGGENGIVMAPDPHDPSQRVAADGLTATTHTRSIGLQLSQSLVDISRWTSLKASRYAADSGAATLEAAQQDLLVRVANTYFGVLSAIDALKFADANEKALARQLEQAQQRFEVGLAAITDVHDAQAQHDQAVASVIANRNAVDQAREAVRQLTDKEPGEFKRLRDELPLDRPTPASPEDWVQVALKQNPALHAASLQVDAANTNIRTAQAGHLPTLSAQLGYSRMPTWGDQRFGGIGSFPQYAGDPKWGSSITLSLNVPIFSGGFTQSTVRQAVHNRDFAQDQFEFNRRLVEATTRNNYRSVIAGASEVEATRAAVVSAQSSVEATQAGYEVGTRTIVDLLISQQTLLAAQSSYSAARHAFVLDGLLLKQAAGVIELGDLEAINALLE